MPSMILLNHMEKEIQNLIQKAFAKAGFMGVDLKIDIKKPAREEFGDFSAIISGNLESEKGKEFETDMSLGKNPVKNIAENIENSKIFNFEFKPPRYVNFFFKKEFLLENLKQILKEKEKYGSSKVGHGRTVVIDYSGPNIAKPFGIGHLRSTIIGQAIYNIYKFLGYKVVGDNHLGDWGTQFGKLIYQIKTKNLDVKKLTIEELEKIYIEFHQQVKENPDLENEARKWFKKLEDGDKEALKIWEACKEISLKEFNRIYDLLGIKIDNALGESFYNNKMQEIFEEMKLKGLTRQSEGAWIVEFANDELPSLVLMKSDGATTYFLRDLATIKYRLKSWKPDLIAYEVGVDQSLHFKQLFKTIEMLGWGGDCVKFVHIVHGLMRSKEGKFSTRRGDTIHLEDVLNEAIERTKEITNKSETSKTISDKEKQILAKQIGIGAIKYNDLSQHHSRDIIFDWDKVVNLKGNSGPYLQYVFTRCNSVLEKAKDKPKINEAISPNEVEMKMIRKLIYFPNVVQKSSEAFSPNLICNYLFELSQEFNNFYDKYSILKADTKGQKEFRLALTAAVGQVIKNGLTLLGIESPKKM